VSGFAAKTSFGKGVYLGGGDAETIVFAATL
jgi:hypothetical protein